MKSGFLISVLAFGLLVVGGCSREGDTPAPASAATDTVPSSAHTTANLHRPIAAPHADPVENLGQSRVAAAMPPPQNPLAARDIAPFPKVGVPVCDSYADVVRQCLNVHTVGRDRLRLRSEFHHATESWKQSLDAGTPSATVAQQCSAFRDAFRTKLNAVGCTGI